VLERVSGAALLAIFAALALVVPRGPLSVDARWSEWMRDVATPALKHAALVFNAAGHGVVRGLTLLLLGLVLLLARRVAALAAFAVAEALTPLATELVKHAEHRPRPRGQLVHATGSSFPSGHASYAGATCVLLVLLYTAPGRKRLAWWPLAALGIAAMAWSRTYLQVHWLSDVVAGSLLGAGIGLLTCATVRYALADADRGDLRRRGARPRSRRRRRAGRR
jgi:undecaprenyl-diphosphatase